MGGVPLPVSVENGSSANRGFSSRSSGVGSRVSLSPSRSALSGGTAALSPASMHGASGGAADVRPQDEAPSRASTCRPVRNLVHRLVPLPSSLVPSYRYPLSPPESLGPRYRADPSPRTRRSVPNRCLCARPSGGAARRLRNHLGRWHGARMATPRQSRRGRIRTCDLPIRRRLFYTGRTPENVSAVYPRPRALDKPASTESEKTPPSISRAASFANWGSRIRTLTN